MKKFFLITFIFVLFSFTSCSDESSDDNNNLLYSYLLAKNNIDVNSFVGGTPYFFELGNQPLVLDSIPVAGKSMYIARFNPTDSEVPLNQQKIFTSSVLAYNGRSVAEESEADETKEIFENDDFEPEQEKFEEKSGNDFDVNIVPRCGINDSLDFLKNIVDEINSDDYEPISRAAADEPSPLPSKSIEKKWNINDSKTFWVETAANSLGRKTAHLLGKTENCYVWVVDSYSEPYIAKGGVKGKVTAEIAQIYADFFEMALGYVTQIFGEAPSTSYYFNDGKYVEQKLPIEYISDTGRKVNLIITDINCDNNIDSPSAGVVGVTYNKDLLSTNSSYGSGYAGAATYSNNCNCVYIDSYYAVAKKEDTISTLVHEYQHLLNYYRKTILNNELTVGGDNHYSSYTELLSMLCEDMMQQLLGVSDEASPKIRTTLFNKNYMKSGIDEFLLNDDRLFSYATSYCFGAFLARNYGGAALVKKIMENSEYGMESYIKAINELNKTNLTTKEVIEDYMKALVFRSDDKSIPSLNKDAATTISYTGSKGKYYYPMTKIDLWSLAQILPKIYETYKNNASYKFDGPYFYKDWEYSYTDWENISKVRTIYGTELRPSGFSLHKIGVVNKNVLSMQVNMAQFDSKVASNQNVKYYLLIQ